MEGESQVTLPVHACPAPLPLSYPAVNRVLSYGRDVMASQGGSGIKLGSNIEPEGEETFSGHRPVTINLGFPHRSVPALLLLPVPPLITEYLPAPSCTSAHKFRFEKPP
jgi:hypothetical protein